MTSKKMLALAKKIFVQWTHSVTCAKRRRPLVTTSSSFYFLPMVTSSSFFFFILFFFFLFSPSIALGTKLPVSTSPRSTSVIPVGSTAPDCPVSCFCSSLSGIVYCSRRGLVSIPDGLASDSLQLNMNGNIFRVPLLQRSNFSTLSNLEHLYLSECGIDGIQVGTFADVRNLQWLDLSNNRIRTISPRSFEGLRLQHLFLNGNRHLELVRESFEGLLTVGLYLHDCSLGRLQREVLAPLSSSLKYLWLNGNELNAFDEELLNLFENLNHLRLSSNPMHCNCRMAWLKRVFDARGAIFKGAVAPSCLGPQRLRGKYFNELDAADFRCQPPMFNNIEAALGPKEGRLKCTASGDPVPVLFWIHPSGTVKKFTVNRDSSSFVQNEGTLLLDRPGPTSPNPHPLGAYVCVATNDAGNVTLTVNVTWPMTSSSMTAGDEDPKFPADVDFERHRRPSSLLLGTAKTPATATTSNDQFSLVLAASRRTVVTAAEQPGSNYTVIGGGRSEKTGEQAESEDESDAAVMFTVTQMVLAVVGTHVCTLVLCLVAVPLCYRSRWTRLKPGTLSSLDDQNTPCTEKFHPSETGSPSMTGTGYRSQFYLPDYFITDQQ